MFDPVTLSLIQGLPIGIAIVILLEGPWIFALLAGKLRTNAAWKERELEYEKQLLAFQKSVETIHEDKLEWQNAWREEQKRGDTATTSLGAAATEMSQVASKLLQAVSPNGPTMGVIEATPVQDGK